jgi:hypothetical protein
MDSHQQDLEFRFPHQQICFIFFVAKKARNQTHQHMGCRSAIAG